MEFIDAPQGSHEWLSIRAKHFTASEAPAMMGASKYTTRAELLRRKATGFEEEVSPAKQVLFNRGHESEADARPIIEAMLGEQLFPVTGTLEVDGLPLLASFDGLTMLGDKAWENKLWNDDLADIVEQDDPSLLEPHYYWQLEQQLLVSGAEAVYFSISNGTKPGTIGVWYVSLPERRAALIAGWKQFADDLANYQHVEHKPAAVGRAPETLPALHVEVTGMVMASNLREFKEKAMAVFENINTDLHTDEDFADAEKTVKWCGEVEARLEAAKMHAQGQMASVDELFRAIDDIRAEARAKRLELDKLVKARKDAIRADILRAGRDAYDQHLARLNERLCGAYLSTVIKQVPDADFAGVMKGRKTLTSLRDAVDTEIARVKIAANELADRIQINLQHLEQHAEHKALFADIKVICFKEADDFKAIVYARIADHKAAEETRLEAERARIRTEEEAKAKAEAVKNTTPSGEAGTPAGARPEPAAPVVAATKREAVIDAEDDVRAFLDSREFKDSARIRAILMEYEAFKRVRAIKKAA